jgi:RNA polymerase sigma factor (sigma-70 family)
MGHTTAPATHQVPTASPDRGPAQTHAFWKNRSNLSELGAPAPQQSARATYTGTNRPGVSAMATPLAHSRRALPDVELAQLAGSGDGAAFAELYDRHEQRVYGFCMRMLGTPHDAAEATQDTFVRMLGRLPALQGRELNFVAYTLATARNACYDMIGSRATVEPVQESPEPRDPPAGQLERDPERNALLQATREAVQAANAALPPRQREVLALRELEGLSYEEIGALMSMNRNAVAQLISRARIKLGEQVRGGALASVSPATPECENALGLLAELQDGQQTGPVEWVRAHLENCETCRVSRATMEEAGASYRALGPVAVLAGLRHATIAHAAAAVGADWSHLLTGAPHGAGTGAGTDPGADTLPDQGAGANAGAGGPAPPAPVAPGTASAGMRVRDLAAASPTAAGAQGSAGGAAPPARKRRRRAAAVLGGALVCALLVAVLAASEDPQKRQPPTHTLTLVSPPVAPAAATLPRPRRQLKTASRPHRRTHKPQPTHSALTNTAPAPAAVSVPNAAGLAPVASTPVTSKPPQHHSTQTPHKPPPTQGKAPTNATTTPTSTATTPAPTPTTTTPPSTTSTSTTPATGTEPTGTGTTGTTTTTGTTPGAPPGNNTPAGPLG